MFYPSRTNPSLPYTTRLSDYLKTIDSEISKFRPSFASIIKTVVL